MEFHPDVIAHIIKNSSMEKNKGKDLGFYRGCKTIFKENPSYVYAQAFGQRNYGQSITTYQRDLFHRL